MTATLKKIWKNEYVQTAAILGLIVLIFVGFWYGAQMVLNTRYPVLAVVTGSMCIPQDSECDGWTHPFEHTLHIGDLIVLQGVNPEDLNANYSNSDIIVYQDPRYPTDLDARIVHRIVAKQEINGTLYFHTKGDGNGLNKWPSEISSLDYDPWNLPNGVPEDQIYGKVVIRIPWLGHVILFMKPFGLPIIIIIIILLVIIEFIVPLIRGKKAPAAEPEQQKETQQQP